MQWFKKHPSYLRDESTRLSNDSNYKEFYQCRDNLFISHGNILVRLGKTLAYPILIVYTNATPYLLPAIFPLIRNLSKEEMDEFAKMEAGQLFEKIKPLVLFYYTLRHQNSSGELCFLEKENLENGNDFYGITTILKRLRDWHAGHTTKKYPPDSEEVEFCSHFNYINSEMKLIYTQQFLNENLLEGDCYAVLYKSTPQTRYLPFSRKIYLSCFFEGVTKSGIIEETNINLEKYFLDDRIRTSIDLITKAAVVKELSDKEILLKAQWFHIENEPQPFKDISELVALIGNGNYCNGIERLSKRCQETFKTIHDFFYLGIRFPNKKGIYEFQLFKIKKLAQPPNYDFGTQNKVVEILKQYGDVEAIRGEKITDETFHQRNGKRADYEFMKNAHINILGVGAIGSEVADSMAKAGIGEITLIDDQQLNVHNAVRHLAGIDMADEFKVFAVAEIIHHHNHFVKINPRLSNLYSLEYNFLHDDSISISSVADDYAEGFVNQQMVIANRIVFYARALRGGKVARIFRVIPGKDACFYCMSLYRSENKEYIDIPEDPDFPTLRNECNNPIRPGSAADLKFIAAFTSRQLIDHIQNGESESNHWIWTSEKIEGTPLQTANQVHQQFIPPHPACQYCNNDKQIKVTIANEVLKLMQELVSQKTSIETGGVLAGYKDENDDIVITHASGPGPKAIQSSTRFEKDIEYCQKYLDDLFLESGRKTVYVGEWHSHPSRNNHPSGLDIKSLSEISIEKGYLTEEPVMIILSNAGKPSCTAHPAGKRYYFTELLISK